MFVLQTISWKVNELRDYNAYITFNAALIIILSFTYLHAIYICDHTNKAIISSDCLKHTGTYLNILPIQSVQRNALGCEYITCFTVSKIRQ